MIKKILVFFLILIMICIPVSGKVLVISNGISLNDTYENNTVVETLPTNDEDGGVLGFLMSLVTTDNPDMQSEANSRYISQKNLTGISTLYIDNDTVELNIMDMWYDNKTNTIAFNLTANVNGNEKLIHNPYKIYNPPLEVIIYDNPDNGTVISRLSSENAILQSISSIVMNFDNGNATFDGIDPTLTIYPKFDAYLTNTTNGTATATMLLSPGRAIANATPAVVDVTRNATSGYVNKLGRYAVNFNTSSVGAAFTNTSVTNVSLQLRGTAKANSAGALSLGVTGYNPSSNITIVTGDFDKNLTTSLAKNKTYAVFSTSAYNIFYFDSNGMSYFDKNKYTNLMARLDEDINSTLPSGTSVATSSFSFRSVAYTGTTQDPCLVVIYESGAATPVSNFAANTTLTYINKPILFNDTTTGIPTSWNWSFGDGTFNTSQNVTKLYTLPGVYNVSLNATNSFGTNTTTKTNYIAIGPNVSYVSGDTVLQYTIPNITTDFTVPSGVNSLRYLVVAGGGGGGYGNTSTGYAGGGGAGGLINNDTYTVSFNNSYNISVGYLGLSGSSGSSSFNGYNGSNSYFGNETAIGGGGGGGVYSVLVTRYSQNGYNGGSGGGGSYDGTNVAIQGNTTNITQGNNGFPSTTTFVGNGGGGGGSNLTYNGTAGITTPIIGGYGFISNITGSPIQYAHGGDSYNASSGGSIYAYSGSGGRGAKLGFTAATNGISGIVIIRYNISTSYDPPNSSFTANITSGSKPLPVLFTDTSTNTPTSWNYSFTNVTGNSTEVWFSQSQNPTWTFNVGNFSIHLNSTNAYGYNISPQTTFINVSEASAMIYPVFSNATANITKIQEKRDTVQFTDQSNNTPTSWNWSFRDGTLSTSQNPNHTWAHFGVFTVNLTATNANTSVIYPNFTVINVTEEMKVNMTANLTKIAQKKDTIQFTDASTNASIFDWNFGDGTANVTTQNPNHTYAIFGRYSVYHNASSDVSYNKTTFVNWINVTQNMITNMSANITKIQENRDTIQFTDSSTNASIWDWGFGDGLNSTLQNPNHTYKHFGIFTVMHNASSDVSYNKTTFVNWVNVTEEMKTNQSVNVTSGYSPLTIQLTDQSTNASIHLWTIGTNTSTSQNPIFTLTGVGKYTVIHNASSDVSFNISTFTNWITINAIPYPIVNFTYNNTGGIQNVPVQFTSDSVTSITGYNWSFGDGNLSTTQNPLYTYSVPGTYTVTLNVTNASGFYNFTSKSNIITITKRVPPIATFTSNATTGSTPLPIQFNDTSITNPTAWNWTFGGANQSYIQNPVYTFVGVGLYTVSLNVSNASYFNTTTFVNYVNVTPTVFTTDFIANTTTGSNYGMTVNFTDLTTDTPTQWNWSFGDNSSFNYTQNPQHVYSVAGNYTVALNSTNAYGSNYSTKTNYIQLTTDLPYVVAWSHADGANGGTTVIDEIGLAATINNLTTSTTQYKFGNASLWLNKFDSYTSTPNSSIFNVGSGDFTIEAWTYPTSSGTNYTLMSKTYNNLSSGWGIYHGSGTTSNDWHFFMGTVANSTDPFTLPLNTWSHIAVERWNGVVYVYVNGNLTTSKTISGSFNNSADIRVGYQDSGTLSQSFQGYVDEYRGSTVVRWYTNFTPPSIAYNGGHPTPDINPSSTFRFKDTVSPMIANIANQTGNGVRNRTIQIQNVNNATYIVGSMTFDQDHLYIKNVYPNTSTWSDVSIVSYNIYNDLGLVEFNVTRPSGFNPGTTPTSFIDTQVLYWNYTPNGTLSSNYFGNGYLINGSTGITYPVHNFIQTVLIYGGWDFYPNFTSNVTSGFKPLTVQFNDTTQGYPTYWNYSWGDNTWTNGTDPNPIHTYNTFGNYSVTLVEQLSANMSVINSTTKVNYIQVNERMIVNMSANITKIQEKRDTIQFFDNSTNASIFDWNFGDGTANVTTQNPNHTYAHFSKYTVYHNASSATSFNKTTFVSWINVTEEMKTNMSVNVTSGYSPLAIQLTDQSTNATSWLWTIGTNTSTSQNPVFTLTGAGLYTVSLNASSDTSFNTTTFVNWINVTTAPPDIIFNNFNANITKIQENRDTVQFTESATNETTYLWDFGDGLTSTSANPNHTYKHFGLKTVSLNASNTISYNITTKVNYINVTEEMKTNMSVNITSGLTPLTIQLTDQSTNATSWLWTIGTNTSTSQNPVFTLTGAGLYTVSLNASSDTSFNTTTFTNWINVSAPPDIIFNNFNANITKIQENVDTIQFTESATNETTYLWNFGDGLTSTLASPNHTYKKFGLKTVSLNASNAISFNITTKTNYINVTEHIITDFSADTVVGIQNEIVTFTDLSNNATAWNWSFGDGGTSTLKNPTHQYTKFGVFTVSLNASTDTDYMTTTKVGYIDIGELMITDFSAIPLLGVTPLNVAFTDLSRNATAWSWDFGDAGTSNLQNPNHIYNTAGLYTVTLTSSSASDSNSTIKVNYITVNTAPIADFIYSGNFGQVLPRTVTFTDTSAGAPTSWDWDFGDGSAHSVLQNPSHTYNVYGTYTVTLTVSNAFGMDSISKSVDIAINDPDKPFVFNTSCAGCGIPVDIANGTYTGQMFGNSMMTGNLSVWDVVVGSMAPWMDGWENATGSEDGRWMIFLIGFLCLMFGYMMETGNTLIPVIMGIILASPMAILIPSLTIPILTTMFAFCIAAAVYKLFIGR